MRSRWPFPSATSFVSVPSRRRTASPTCSSSAAASPGLRAALAVPPGMQVLVVTKDRIQQSNSTYAQGGIAAVRSPEDRFENHIEDTLVAGAGLCDRAVVETVVREAPQQIDDLIRFGAKFDDGMPGIEGGHSHHRIVHALGDATGFEVMRAIIDDGARRRRTSPSGTAPSPSICSPTTRARASGRWSPGTATGDSLIWAKQTILASGGAGMVYRETTNPPVATGDGMAAAYRAGAELRDMEFMQFHPTVLYVAGSSRHLISEAVRGEGAYLRDKDGVRFMLGRGPARRAGHARRGRPGHRPPHGADAASQRLPRPVAPRPDEGARALPRHRPRSAGSSASTSPATRSRCGPGRTTWSAASRSTRRAGRRCRACGRPARSRRAACTGPIGWRRTVCSRGWCSARCAAGRPPRRPPRMPDTFTVPPVHGRLRAGDRRPGPGRRRPDQFAAQPDGAQHGHHPRPRPGCWRRSGRWRSGAATSCAASSAPGPAGSSRTC